MAKPMAPSFSAWPHCPMTVTLRFSAHVPARPNHKTRKRPPRDGTQGGSQGKPPIHTPRAHPLWLRDGVAEPMLNEQHPQGMSNKVTAPAASPFPPLPMRVRWRGSPLLALSMATGRSFDFIGRDITRGDSRDIHIEGAMHLRRTGWASMAQRRGSRRAMVHGAVGWSNLAWGRG